MKQKILVVGGPTASGKSGFALCLARNIALNGFTPIILNADSMQIYNALPILSAQPTMEDKAEFTHKFYGSLEVEEVCSAARWRDMVLSEIQQNTDPKTIFIIVGGTGFYMKALLEGLSPIPEIPPIYREKGNALHTEIGTKAFYALLYERDKETALKIESQNKQRLIRAWEVLEFTGKPLVEWQSIPRIKPPEYLEFYKVILCPNRENLYSKCNQRFHEMLKTGALEEVEGFRKKIEENRSLSEASITTALGFKEIRDFQLGEVSQEEAVEKACQRTRQYAKRQTTWFRNQIEADLRLEKYEEKLCADLIERLFKR